MHVSIRLFARGAIIGLMAFLLIAGPAFADTSSVAVDGSGTLNQSRTTATLTGNVVCAAPAPAPGSTTTETATITVHIFQSVGRLINIGIGEVSPITCDGSARDWSAVVEAIPGLTFQPGPATVVVRSVTTVTTTTVTNDPITGPITTTTTTLDADQEFGGLVNLRPFHK